MGETKDGKVYRSPGRRLEVWVQDLVVSVGVEGSKVFQLDWVGIKSDNRTCFNNRAEALGNHETREQEDSKILWGKELKENSFFTQSSAILAEYLQPRF